MEWDIVGWIALAVFFIWVLSGVKKFGDLRRNLDESEYLTPEQRCAIASLEGTDEDIPGFGKASGYIPGGRIIKAKYKKGD